MRPTDAQTVLMLLQHLDGSHMADPDALLPRLLALHASAAAAFRSGALPLDEDALLDVLGEVAQRHADAAECWQDDDQWRPTEDVPVGGLL